MSVFQHIQRPSVVYMPGSGDPFVTRLSDWIEQTYQPDNLYDLAVIGVPLSKSSISFSGAHTHPTLFRQLWSSFTTFNADERVDLSALKAVDLGDVPMHVTDIWVCHRNVEDALYEAVSRLSAVPILIGGDHSISYPAVKGIKRARGQRIGLIHFDAHLDVRDTAYGGPTNGTPMRSLIESGTVAGEDIVTIGLRSFANSRAYWEYAEYKGMTMFTANQVRQRGIETVLQAAVDYLNARCEAIYVTFDVDVLDQSVVPGVPAAGPAGLSAVELFYSARQLGAFDKVTAMDIVCVDPTKDVRDLTSRVSLHLFLHFATGYYHRKHR